MDIYKVILKSQDGHIFEFTTEATCVIDAEFRAFRKISGNNWDHHQYKVQEIKVISLKD
jgi:hypothetical protein